MSPQKPNRKNPANFIRYASLGFEMMAIIAGFTFLGYKIDQWMENDFKGFTMGFTIFSVIVAILYGVRNLLKNKNHF